MDDVAQCRDLADLLLQTMAMSMSIVGNRRGRGKRRDPGFRSNPGKPNGRMIMKPDLRALKQAGRAERALIAILTARVDYETLMQD